jgi:cation diffusion facilitator CzcD-associated flavoprotein CzcO
MESFDLVIVGAGIHGLTMLKTYRDVHPHGSIMVLDKASSIGSVWAKDMLYPRLHTNNHFRTFEVGVSQSRPAAMLTVIPVQRLAHEYRRARS